METRLQREFTL